MTVSLLPAVGLLERSVGYTRGALAEVTPAHLDHPTPCRGWDLARLLRHMDDALDAFTEASAGTVSLDLDPGGGAPVPVVPVVPLVPVVPVVGRLRVKACTLLAAWADPPPLVEVALGEHALPSDLLVSAGALEIAVHGWDVSQATGRPRPIPEDLARRLLPVAGILVGAGGRRGRFAPERPVRAAASYSDRLVAFTGRHP